MKKYQNRATKLQRLVEGVQPDIQAFAQRALLDVPRDNFIIILSCDREICDIFTSDFDSRKIVVWGEGEGGVCMCAFDGKRQACTMQSLENISPDPGYVACIVAGVDFCALFSVRVTDAYVS